VDIGTQYNERFGSSARKVMLSWEIPDCTIDVDGKPMPRMISKDFTLSIKERSALKPFLEAWRGRAFTEEELSGFDLRAVLGAPCQMQIIHNNAGYERVNCVIPLSKGADKPKPATETIYFDLTDPNCLDVIDRLPGWVRDKIKASPQYSELTSEMPAHDDFYELDEDDLPF